MRQRISRLIACPQSIAQIKIELKIATVKALRRWLEANELLAIVTGVVGALVVLSDMLSQHGSRPRVRPRLDIDRPQVLIADILQGHRHDL